MFNSLTISTFKNLEILNKFEIRENLQIYYFSFLKSQICNDTISNVKFIVYVCLQEELREIKELEKHLRKDSDQINEKIREMDEKMEKFGNIEDLKTRKEQKHQVS